MDKQRMLAAFDGVTQLGVGQMVDLEADLETVEPLRCAVGQLAHHAGVSDATLDKVGYEYGFEVGDRVEADIIETVAEHYETSTVMVNTILNYSDAARGDVAKVRAFIGAQHE